MASKISLNCLILGLDDAKAFPVDILLSKTVSHLKIAIKKEKENQLSHIDADCLVIWKVNYPAHAVYPPLLMYSDATRFAAQGTPFKWGHRQHT